MESYTFDLVRQLTAEQQTVSVYASVFDTTVPEYRQIQAVHINQKRIPKKLRPYFFARQLDRKRRPGEPLIACNPSDHADVFICGGTHLGYLQGMQQQANLLDKLTIRRNRSNYESARSIMAHSQQMQREQLD